MENVQPVALLGHIEQLLREGKINDTDLKRIVKQALDEKHLASFADSIFLKYKALAAGTSIGCSNSWSKNLNISFSDLKEACSEIETDLRIILVRRKELIGKDEKTGSPRMARGKIAGVTTFRLARAHIIHLNPDCVKCNDDRIMKGQSPCPVMNLNIEFALCCGLEFVKKTYSTIPKEIRAELVYTLTKRHMNQETLGIIFDALQYMT